MTRRPRGVVVRRSNSLQLGAPTRTPLAAVLLTIDAAKCSGCALYDRGKLVSYSEVDAHEPDARTRVLREALVRASSAGVPLGLVIEATFGGFVSAACSLSTTVGLWRDSWKRCAQAPTGFLEVTVGEWRRALFGRRALSRTAARALESQVATTTARRDLPRVRHHTIGPDAAAAICIGQVMVRSSGVRSALGCELVTSERLAK